MSDDKNRPEREAHSESYARHLEHLEHVARRTAEIAARQKMAEGDDRSWSERWANSEGRARAMEYAARRTAEIAARQKMANTQVAEPISPKRTGPSLGATLALGLCVGLACFAAYRYGYTNGTLDAHRETDRVLDGLSRAFLPLAGAPSPDPAPAEKPE